MTVGALDFGTLEPQVKPGLADAGSEFVWTREPDPAFVRGLRDLSPVSDERSHLIPWWEPGEKWMPGQRWMLFEAVQPQLVGGRSNPRVVELLGPHPRSAGHYCSDYVEGQFQCHCKWKTESWRGGPCSIVTLTEYNIFKATGLVAFPYWIVQGTRGGHRTHFNDQEQSILKMLDLPHDPPAVGVLDYAPLDGHVLAAIAGLNRLIQFGNDLEAYRNAMRGDGYEKTLEEGERRLRELTVKCVEDQMLDVQELFVKAAAAGDMDDQPRTDIDYDALWEPSKAHYIETGQMLHHSAV